MRWKYSSRLTLVRQCPVSMAAPVTATNSPTTRTANTRPGTARPPGARISSVAFTGQAATHR